MAFGFQLASMELVISILEQMLLHHDYGSHCSFPWWEICSGVTDSVWVRITDWLCDPLSDAVREVQKYSGPQPMHDAKVNPNVYDHVHMKLFRAQRNLYISGFSLFLWLWVSLLCSFKGGLESLNGAFNEGEQPSSSEMSKMLFYKLFYNPVIRCENIAVLSWINLSLLHNNLTTTCHVMLISCLACHSH